jgi:acyl-CoA reductase-like NAD-dependent aldehyde dehydrogenase
LPYTVREAGLLVGSERERERESTSRVRLGVLYTVRDMYSFLSEYFSPVVFVLHAIRCRAAQVE